MKQFIQHIELIIRRSQKRIAKNILLTACFLLLTLTATAQVFPVQINQSIIPPYNTKLNSYETSSDIKLRLYLTMTDVTISNRQVRLKLKIQGNGINIQSTDFVTGAPSIFLNGGAQQQFTNIDLAPYFRLNNLVGINPQQYNQPLPDGIYKICWEVYDFRTNQLISNANMGCSNIILLLNDPPFLNLPNRGDQLTDIQPTNIIFQWTPRHANATNVSYEFELRELWDNQIDPQAGFLASPPYHTETTFSTTVLYNISKPQLFPGRTYAWRVRAKSTTGLSENSVFRNNGYSEIFYFTYTNTCYPPTFTLAEPLKGGRVKISWQTHPEHNKYHVQYKRADVADADWFELFSYNNQVQIANLQDGITYDFRVGGTCHQLTDFDQAYSFSSINQFTMPTADETVSYSCGIVPEIEITNTSPLENIGVNETFTAGDFPVTIKQIQGGNGMFSGTGFIVVPYLADTKIAVEFSGIKINTDYQLYDGIIKTTYNPTWSSVEDVGEFFNDLIKSIKDLLDKIRKKRGQLTEEEIDEFKKESTGFYSNLNSQIDSLLNEGKLTEEKTENLKQILQESKEAFDNSLIASNDDDVINQAIEASETAEDKLEEVQEAISSATSTSSNYSEEEILAGEEKIDGSLINNDNSTPINYNNYVAPSGIPITLPKNTPYNPYKSGNLNIPKGVVISFKIGDSIYYGFHYKEMFTGYKTGKKKKAYEFQEITNTKNLYVTVPRTLYKGNCEYYEEIYKYNHTQDNLTAKGKFAPKLDLEVDVISLFLGLDDDSNGLVNTCLPSISYDSYNNKIFGYNNYYEREGFLSSVVNNKGTLSYVYSGPFGENGEIVYLQYNENTGQWKYFNTPSSDCLSCDLNRMFNTLFSSDVGHFLLDVAGMAPVAGELFDALNGVWYIIEEDGVNAAISFASTIPLVYASTVKNIGRVIKLSDGTFAAIKLSSQATKDLITTLKKLDLSDDAFKALFKDLQNTSFAKALAENPNYIDSWKILYDAGRTNLRKTPDALKSIINVMQNPKAQNVFGNEMNVILKKFAKFHKSSFENKLSFSKHMDMLLQQVNKYEGVEGFNKSIRDAMNTANVHVQDGFWHMMKDMTARNIPKNKLKKVDMQFDGENLPCTNCKFDLELVPTNTEPIRFLEYKSYSDASKISKPQFLNYFTNITNLNELNYVFSGIKLSLDEAKLGMKQFLKNNELEIIENMSSQMKLDLNIFDDALELTQNQINNIADSITTIFKK